MHLISDELVEKTWQDIGSLTDPNKIKKLGSDFSKEQPDIVEFVLQFTTSLRAEVREVGFYAALVVWQCFKRASSMPLEKIQSEEIIKLYEAFDSELGSLIGAHDKFLQRRGERLAEYPQPAIFLYILETIFEEKGDVTLNEEEQGELFTILKVVADCFCSSI